MKINDLEGQLITSKPVGGMPETAKDQLEKFMVGLLWTWGSLCVHGVCCFEWL